MSDDGVFNRKEFKLAVGRELAGVREEKGPGVGQMAALMKVNKGLLHRMETGAYLDLVLLFRLAECHNKRLRLEFC